ncbi:hypothetical protein KSP39_PZI022634 [Platanthera zijinensis]|uniref:Uncharacterized protein n=1 Tax=Platanthera zijinensis TaxID=2320716 RepID=A0AAP0FV39_9ASPA
MSSTIKVRFLIDREQQRVVFAEAGSDFVDVLFSFLTLPLGRIVRLLNKQSCSGSLDSIYNSVERLDIKHLKTEACQDMLLNPRSVAAEQCEGLKIKGIHEHKPRIYTCSQDGCLIQSTCYYTYSSKCLCHRCGKLMDKCSEWSKKTSEKGGIFVDYKDNFMITDDLRVIPTSLLKGLSIFKEMQIKEGSMLEERVIDFGTKEAMNLLGKSLVSKNALTLVCFPDAIKEQISVNEGEKEINLKLVLNKNNNNILYAEVGEDFINLLFSFLTFPLGSVLRLFSNNISLGGCVKNLYSSAESLGLECFKSEICRNMLLNPKLPPFYGCNKNQILQLEEITSDEIFVLKGCRKCYVDNGYKPIESAPCEHGIEQAEFIEWNPKFAKIMVDAGDAAFVVGSRKYMISDNLHVSPLSIISAVGSGMNLSISEMVGKEVFIDNYKVIESNVTSFVLFGSFLFLFGIYLLLFFSLQMQARSLLGAMLTSKTVLTDIFSSKPTRKRKSL